MSILENTVRHVAMAKMVPFLNVHNLDSSETSLFSTQVAGYVVKVRPSFYYPPINYTYISSGVCVRDLVVGQCKYALNGSNSEAFTI